MAPASDRNSSSPPPLIEVENLCKSYGPVRALENVSFSVREGEVMGFLGPNGAGKSTTLRILAGFLPGDSGTVRICGLDVARSSLEVRRLVGYLPEGVPLYPELRVQEYLRFRARLKGVSLRKRRQVIDRSLEAVGIMDVKRRVIGTLSRGYRQRVGLADALLNEPRLLILDEPTVGLDPEQVRQFRSLLRAVGQDRTVILSTHILSEVELVCSSVVIISEGKIAVTDSADRLRRLTAGRGSSTVVEIAGPDGASGDSVQSSRDPVREVTAALKELEGVASVRTDGSAGEGYYRWRVFSAQDADVREVIYEMVRSRGWKMRHLERIVRPLEEVFLDIVGKES